MKRMFILCVAALTAAGARADLVLQQQIVAPNYTGVTTMKIKGSKIRMDMLAGESNAWSNITDLKTGESITLVHAQKMFLKAQGEPAKPGRSASPASHAPVPRPTGQTQKVGDYDTQLYTWSNASGITGTAWVAKNFPDYDRIRNDIAVLDKSPGADNDTSPSLSTLPGMVVRSQVAGGGQTITLALISAKEGPLDDSLFGVPRGYKEMPKVQPAKTVITPAAPQKSTGNPIPRAPVSAGKSPAPPAKKLPAW
jgi:Domain of unknown function (DUF4412)